MNIASIAFRKAQYAYDNAEPDYAIEAHERAVEAQQDELWRTAEAVQDCITFVGVNTLPLATCQEMVRAATDPNAPRWLVELIAYIDDHCVKPWAEQLVEDNQ